MRRPVLLVLLVVIIVVLAFPLFAQPSRRMRPPRAATQMDAVEIALRQAAEQLARDRKIVERDVSVLRHLRAAASALADAMQPANALEKAHEEVSEAKRLAPDFTVMQGLIKVEQALDDARRSPGAADFDRLRTLLRNEALTPASRAATRDALDLQDDTVAWLKVQQQIANHLRAIAELSADSLRAAQEE